MYDGSLTKLVVSHHAQTTMIRVSMARPIQHEQHKPDPHLIPSEVRVDEVNAS